MGETYGLPLELLYLRRLKKYKIKSIAPATPWPGDQLRMKLTTRRAYKMTPTLHTSAFLPSYFSPLEYEKHLKICNQAEVLGLRFEI
uniref:Uncharacterized protein n=1 Tax=Romanomermis culicivorax TaxID=13658 RepID=A0A915HUU8_ROMCU